MCFAKDSVTVLIDPVQVGNFVSKGELALMLQRNNVARRRLGIRFCR